MTVRPVRASASPLTIADRRKLNAARLEARREFKKKRLQARYLIAVGGAWPFLDSVSCSELRSTHRIFQSLPPVTTTLATAKWFGSLHPLGTCQKKYFLPQTPHRNTENEEMDRGQTLMSPRHVEDFRQNGYTVIEGFLPSTEDVYECRRKLINDPRAQWSHPMNSSSTRDDEISWFQPVYVEDDTCDNETYSFDTQSVRILLTNLFRRLRRELVEICGVRLCSDGKGTDEYQLARYSGGANGYARHCDHDEPIELTAINQFLAKDCRLSAPGANATHDRAVSAVLYLNNQEWDDGGELRLWPAPHSTASGSCTAIDVKPTGGRLVLFLSGAIPHQVRPRKKVVKHRGSVSMVNQEARVALTVWYHSPCEAVWA